jgi:hypothetical protein
MKKPSSKKTGVKKVEAAVVPARGGVPVKAHIKAGRAKPPQ